MTRPLRLHHPAIRFFDLQAVSRAANGLPGRSICGASNWRNPYDDTLGDVPAVDRRALYVHMLRGSDSRRGQWVRAHVHELKGCNLFCRCAQGEPCHGDVLIVLANSDVPIERALQ